MTLNGNSLHRINPCGYKIYPVIFLPKITVSISCDIQYQLLFLLYKSHGNTQDAPQWF